MHCEKRVVHIEGRQKWPNENATAPRLMLSKGGKEKILKTKNYIRGKTKEKPIKKPTDGTSADRSPQTGLYDGDSSTGAPISAPRDPSVFYHDFSESVPLMDLKAPLATYRGNGGEDNLDRSQFVEEAKSFVEYIVGSLHSHI